VLSILALALWAATPAEPSFEIVGLPKTAPFTRAEVEKLGTVEAEWNVHGKSVKVRGVLLAKVLEARGFEPGPMSKAVSVKDKRAGYRRAIVARASDGFTAVFSAGEIFAPNLP
jgi:hypothetical protein